MKLLFLILVIPTLLISFIEDEDIIIVAFIIYQLTNMFKLVPCLGILLQLS